MGMGFQFLFYVTPVAYIYLYIFFTRRKTLYNPFSAFLPVEAVVRKKKPKKSHWLGGMQKETKFLPSHQGRKCLASDIAAKAAEGTQGQGQPE